MILWVCALENQCTVWEQSSSQRMGEQGTIAKDYIGVSSSVSLQQFLNPRGKLERALLGNESLVILYSFLQ